MGSPHKHKDVIIAWANGEQIEWNDGNYDNVWKPCIGNPSWRDSYDYRVKPKEPVKKYKVAYAIVDAGHTSENVSNKYCISVEEFIASYAGNILWAVLLEPTMKEFEQ